MIQEAVHIICEKAREVELFCLYNNNWAENLLVTSLSYDESVNDYKLKRSFAVVNIRQIDYFLSESIVEAKRGKIENRVILLSTIDVEKMPNIFDFIVFDKKMVLALDKENNGGYYLSTEPFLLGQCEQWLNVASVNAEDIERFFLQEPLMKSADMVYEMASVMCSHDHIDSESCYWYHSVWQYLRLADMVSTPSWHHNFYLEQIASTYKEASEVKVLISGAADYASLSYVVRALEKTNASATYSVLDLCETPLFSCRWYAKRKNIL